MAWHAVYETVSGRLLAVGSDEPVAVPVGASERVYAERPDQGAAWDETLRDFVALIPAPILDRIDAILADSDLTSLNAPVRTRIRNALARTLPDWARFY